MANGLKKGICIAIEEMVIEEITKVLGEGEDYLSDGFATQWIMPYGETGKITFTLWKDSREVGNVYRNSWLAGRLDDRAKHVGEDGYTKPRDQIEGGWPFPFTYPSGKYNLYFSEDMEQNKRDLATYLYAISAPGSQEKIQFGKIEFETVD